MAENLDVEREGQDITASHMLIPEEMPSDIRNFYEGSVIFITGGTGFLGNLVIEKLLRSCPELSRMYILIRPKKGKNPEERFEEIFKDIVFEKMRIEQPKFYEKISLIMGDCELPNLGISDEDKQTLIANVNIIFHVAATVRFDEKLRRAVAINVRATRDIIELSRTMQNLKALVYVSTAYSHCTQKKVDEIFYDVPISGNKLIEITELLDDNYLEALTPTMVGKWPNTYAYTKAIAESVVRDFGKGLPISVVRPSIVISTYKEPVAGWINNFYGAVGISTGAAIGVLRTLHCIPENLADVVPADLCINAIITSAWVVGHPHSHGINNEKTHNVAFDELVMQDDIPIFNFVSSVQNPLTWRRYMGLCEMHGLKFPSPLCLWYYCFYLNPNKYVHQFCVIFLHYVPGFIFDMCLRLVGKEPLMLKAYKKIHKFANVLTYFTLKEWIFKDNNTQAMVRKLNKTDRQLFDFNISALCWSEYFYTFVKGGRVYLLKDPLETLPQARTKYLKLKIAHYTLVTLIALAFFKVIWILIYPYL